jgi:hypothetical protein
VGKVDHVEDMIVGSETFYFIFPDGGIGQTSKPSFAHSDKELAKGVHAHR